MSAILDRLAEQMFVGPVWPASMLACLMVAYTLLSLVGLIDLDFDAPDIDLDPGLDLDVPELDLPDLDVPDLGADVDVGVDAPDTEVMHMDVDFLQGIGAATVRYTNFGRVPIVIWGGIFTVAYWTISAWLWHTFDSHRYEPTWLASSLLSIRNFVIATALTKGLTQPMLSYFRKGPSYDKHHLLGCTCEISSIEATPTFGQAKFRTETSPLLLNVRTNGPTIPKGTEVRIIGFDSQKRIYTVSNLQPETQL